MDMPLLLPQQLNYCSRIDSQESLLKLLLKNPPDLILFLETACADETWSDSHELFLQQAIEWVQQHFFEDQLMIEFAYRIATVLRKHPDIAKKHLINNILLKLQDTDLPVNTLMYGSCSHYLKDLIRLECRDRKSKCIYLKDIPFTVLEPIHEYIMKGYSDSLYIKEKKIGESILLLAQLWELPEFVFECQQALKKWINRDNVIDILLKSHLEKWSNLRSNCYEFINYLELEARLLESTTETMIFEFLRFSENSLHLFDLLRLVISHLVFSGNLTEQPEFSQVIRKCPDLIGLDLSYTTEFTESLRNIPEDLEELKLISCSWITIETLNIMATICPQLLALSLDSNSQLNYQFWIILQKFKNLFKLDLARCAQITDEDLRLILESCNLLTFLNLEDCRHLSDKGFAEISQLKPKLISLNLSRTKISDGPLIEIATQCYDLNHLNLTRCEKITDKGLFEAARSAKKLKEIIITNTAITLSTKQSIKKIKPFLKIID